VKFKPAASVASMNHGAAAVGAGVVGAGLAAHAAVTAIRRAADRKKTQAERTDELEH
jgi:3-hydroxyacyl-CoA dehydrogenase